jgi:uncharacterized protein YodC (DUF2158 family)
MKNKFNVGDVVQLKSGSISITIDELIIEYLKNDLSKQEFCGNYICIYFDENKVLRREKISEDVLTNKL